MRNQFNLSCEHKTSVDMGELVPVYCDEVLPGDTYIMRSTALCRVAPLAHPLMHRVELRMHSFYVPNRIAYDPKGDFEWEAFITGEDDTTAKPTYVTTGSGERLLDYMGVPPGIAGLEIDAAPIRAANMIWNHYYRDQDLQAERDLMDVSVPRCAWQKDYFTVARPQPQQGDPVPIPISGDGRIRSLTPAMTPGTDLSLRLNAQQVDFYEAHDIGTGNVDPMLVSLDSGGIQIDDLRRSIALQRFAEARMRFGSRYVDYLRYLGVNPSDGRLDRPEYLGGGKETLSFSEVLSTAEVPTHSVGEMFGHGIGMGRTNGFRKMFEEHGWVITFLSARPKTVYQNALCRKFTRKSAMDYWQKELEVLPWQEVKQQEVDASGDADTVFGYVPRYEEYRHGVSTVSNTMRGGPENDWHMAREFETPPMLNGSFVTCDPTDRIYQDANMADLVINVSHSIKARRLVGATASMGQDL